MSERRRIALALAVAASLGGLALLFGSREEAELPEREQPSASPEQGSEELRSELRKRIERGEVLEEARAAKREDPQGEPGPRERTLRHYAALGRAAEPVGRRFFAAFARYELGKVDRELVATLRSTASAGFARELLRSPPRLPPATGKIPKLAVLGRVEFVPGAVSRGRIVGGELVGYVSRGGRSEPIALRLALEHGRWRIAGIG